MFGALLVRFALVLAGAALIERFAWVLLVLAALLLAAGAKMLCADDGDEPGATRDDSPGVARPLSAGGSCRDGEGAPTEASDGAGGAGGTPPVSPGGKAAGSAHWAVRCVGSCMPLQWSDETGGGYTARGAGGRLSATRMSVAVVGIVAADAIFAMDSIPAVLSLTTSPFVLVASQVGLR